MSFYRVTFDKTLKRQVDGLPGKLRQEARHRIADLAAIHTHRTQLN